ncbi:homocysteine S-methyltransferase family protein [Eggerthella sinensis]
MYELGPDAFARAMEPLVAAGATMVGGCCGTGPAHIERLSALAVGKTS